MTRPEAPNTGEADRITREVREKIGTNDGWNYLILSIYTKY